LAAQWIDSAAITSHMPGEQGEVDERTNVVHCVVVLGNSQRPADLRAGRFGKSMGRLPDDFSRHSSFTLGALQRVALHAFSISFKSTGGVLDKFFVGETGSDDLAGH